MNFTQSQIDDLNAVLTVTVEKADYADKVAADLKNYRKNANVPGFRKGQVPMSMIKKQYEMPLIYEEVNKLLQSGVENYLRENKIDILGQPLPKADENFSWEAEELNFSFDLGLAPDFEVDLEKVEIPYHKIEISEEDVDKYVDNFALRYGKMSAADEVKEGAVLKGVFHEVGEDGEVAEGGEHYHSTLRFDDLKAKDAFEGKKVEDKITVASKDLYEDENLLAETLGLEEAGDFDKTLQFKINEIVNQEKAAIDQDLFDKVYGEGEVDSEEAFRKKVKEEAEKMYEGEADRVMLSAVLMDLVENSSFNLPDEFLKKWLKFNSEEPKTDEEVEKIYNDAKKGMRYQLIEGKIADKFEIEVKQEDILDQAVKMIKQQMQMYGISNPEMDDNQLKQIAMSSLQNENEYKRLADQVFAEKMLAVVKDKVKLVEKTLSFDEFVEEVKKQNEKAEA